MSSSVEKPASGELIEAAAWRVRLTEVGSDALAPFETWLSLSEDNRRAWSCVQQSWDRIGEHATSPELLEVRRAALGRAREASRKRWLGSVWRQHWLKAAAGGLAATLIAVVWNLSNADVYRTASGERRLVRLADGSQVNLDSSTELRVRYSRRARDLVLTRGQARFDVAHDVARPFAVNAVDRKVIATGTNFNVDLLDHDLFVTLIEGSVVVTPRRMPECSARSAECGAELNVGEQLAVLANGATARTPINIERAVAWESGQLLLENERLSAVIERFNRYSTRRLVLDDDAGDLRISGVFNSSDVDGFVSTVTHYLSLRAEEREGIIHLHR